MSELKECCSTCKFPLDIQRDIVVMDSNVFSVASYNINVCEECGHQEDGSTIPIVAKIIRELHTEYKQQLQDIISFLMDYEYLTKEQRTEICSYKYNAKLDIEEPCSWNVVYHELIAGTQLGLLLVRDRIRKGGEINYEKQDNLKRKHEKKTYR